MPGASRIIKRAAQVWNYKHVHITFNYDSCLGDNDFPSDRANGISRVDFGILRSEKIAEAVSHGNNRHEAHECDIRFNIAVQWNLSRNKPKYNEFNLYSVALHEFGHCLGLGHSRVAGAVMADTAVSGVMLRKLQQDDIAGRNHIYGQ